MVTRCFPPYLLALALCGAAMASAWSAEPTPGQHRRLAVDGDHGWTYDLYVPPAYAQQPEERFPVLYLSSPTSNPGTFDLHDWAGSRGVLIVSINDSKNGLTGEQTRAIQEAVLATVTTRYRTHPHLNMAAGISGGANASLSLVNRHPEMFCGVLLQCMGGTPRAGHIAVGWIHGAKDDVIGVRGVWSAYDRLKDSGRCTITVNRSRKHTPGSKDEKERAMEHALWWGRLTHPKIGREERQRYYHMLNEEMAALEQIPDLQARIRRAEFLIAFPNAGRAPSAGALVESWGRAYLARIEAETNPGNRLLWLQDMGSHPLLGRQLPREIQAQARELMNELRNDQDARIWVTASRRFAELFEMEQRAGLNRSQIAETQQGFAELAAALPEDHPIGTNAANNANRLTRHLDGR